MQRFCVICFPGTTRDTNIIMLVSLVHMTWSMIDNTFSQWHGWWALPLQR